MFLIVSSDIVSGIHPHDAKSWDDETCNEIKEAARCAECVAIGECGLDFNRNFSPPETQIEVFEKQVNAEKMKVAYF